MLICINYISIIPKVDISMETHYTGENCFIGTNLFFIILFLKYQKCNFQLNRIGLKVLVTVLCNIKTHMLYLFMVNQMSKSDFLQKSSSYKHQAVLRRSA